MLNETEAVFMVWPMCQFEKDFKTLEKIGEGHYGKVYSAKRRESKIKTKKEQR